MRRPAAFVLAALTTAALASPAAAGPTTTYRGKATSKDRSFRYGKVTLKVRDQKVTNLKIESVTTNGCAGVTAINIVFAPGSRGQQIVGGSARIKKGRFVVSFRPDRTVEEQVVSIRATITKRSASGIFESVGICTNEGRFTAKR